MAETVRVSGLFYSAFFSKRGFCLVKETAGIPLQRDEA